MSHCRIEKKCLVLFIIMAMCVVLAGSGYATDYTETKLTASDGSASDRFGYSVAIDDDVVIVGAYTDDDMGDDSGSAYIYQWDGTSWNETKLTASDGAEYDYFSKSLAIDGNTIVIGAGNDDDNGSNSGAAYIYRWDGTTWNETKLTASDGVNLDYFGRSVAISGDTVIVGAPLDDNNESNSGSAYIY